MELLLKEVLDSLPESPGVYMLKDKGGKTTYIGKAKNLRSRLRSYFQQSMEKDQRPHIPYLMQEVQGLDYLVTPDEREALILENSLIKKSKPKYNILLKDDKTYASLKLDPRETFPKLTFTRRILKDGAIYFGPFASGKALRQTKRLIHKIFPLRDCTEGKFKRHTDRPCLNYHMKLCLGPCAGMVDKKKYLEVVDQTKMFLKGERKEIINLLRKNMGRASEEMRYEDAALYRDQIKLLEKHIGTPLHISGSLLDKDIVGCYREGQSVEFVVLFSRGGAIIDKADFSFERAAGEDDEIVREFLGQFYGPDRFMPKEIIIPIRFEGMEVFSEWLSERQGTRVKIAIPERGYKVKLDNLAMRNAEEGFKRKSAERQNQLDLVKQIKDSLFLSDLPVSIECFDVSNIQGDLAVASMVRFENGKPAKKKYKKFKIKTVFGANDYAMMHEVLSRRFTRAEQEGWELPNLILVDGGKGQLNVVNEVINELGFSGKVELASIAKGREIHYSIRSSRINQRGHLGSMEGDIDKIYIPGRMNPLSLSKNSQELLFLMRVRDEAHRFAITYHKKLRTKKAFESELDFVPGIGAKRKTMLLKHFGSVSRIKEASIEEISSIPGMSRSAAEEVKQYLAH
ncbi:MAG: excinuclease ABC subunit UvrC [Thermodesulfobacteriota bacterium]